MEWLGFSPTLLNRKYSQLLDAVDINGSGALDLWIEIGMPTNFHVGGLDPAASPLGTLDPCCSGELKFPRVRFFFLGDGVVVVTRCHAK